MLNPENLDLADLAHAGLDHAWIARHIPHQGNMCLLDKVAAWDETQITCLASSHRALDNPLRANGRLGVACGIEYAAQAMAVHGALLAPADSELARVGYLVSVRGVSMHVTRLDQLAAELVISASCMVRGDNNILYEFSVSADGKLLLAGRATVVVNADKL